MPAVACENISCGSPPYLLNPVPPNEKLSCLNQYRPRVVSWDPPSSQSTQLHSSCGGPSHYVGYSPHVIERLSFRPQSRRPEGNLTTRPRPLVVSRHEAARLLGVCERTVD